MFKSPEQSGVRSTYEHEREKILESARKGYFQKLVDKEAGVESLNAQGLHVDAMAESAANAATPREEGERGQALREAQEKLTQGISIRFIGETTADAVEEIVRSLSQEAQTKFYEQAPTYMAGRETEILGDDRKLEQIACEFQPIQNVEGFGNEQYILLSKALLRNRLLSYLASNGFEAMRDSDPNQQEIIVSYLTAINSDDKKVVEMGKAVFAAFGHEYHRKDKEQSVGHGLYREYDPEALLIEIFKHDPDLFSDLSVLSTLRQRIVGRDAMRHSALADVLTDMSGGVSHEDDIPYRNHAELERIRTHLKSLSQDIGWSIAPRAKSEK